jgi:hypothetical protein
VYFSHCIVELSGVQALYLQCRNDLFAYPNIILDNLKRTTKLVKIESDPIVIRIGSSVLWRRSANQYDENVDST